jgi:hypothetical protein
MTRAASSDKNIQQSQLSAACLIWQIKANPGRPRAGAIEREAHTMRSGYSSLSKLTARKIAKPRTRNRKKIAAVTRHGGTAL